MTLMKSYRHLALCAAVPLLLLTGACSSYHCGSLMHPQIKTIGIGAFKNDTEEAMLTVALRQKLSEAFIVDGSVKIVDAEQADAVVQGRIVSVRMESAASGRMQGVDRNGDNNRDHYQTEIFRTIVTVEFELVKNGRRRPILDLRPVTGTAEYSKLPDLHVARNEALRRAAGDAALNICAGVTEGW